MINNCIDETLFMIEKDDNNVTKKVNILRKSFTPLLLHDSVTYSEFPNPSSLSSLQEDNTEALYWSWRSLSKMKMPIALRYFNFKQVRYDRVRGKKLQTRQYAT